MKAFEKVDVILGPSTPDAAFPLGARVSDPVSMYLADIYTCAINLAGLPGLSLPVGFKQHLPVGMQLIGHYFSEAKLLNIAHCYQQHTDWHLQQPQGI
jgi:aspartyl-tRNA(Asn)/glutamyl-tRNA(Gln) amidotransferase subunit A